MEKIRMVIAGPRGRMGSEAVKLAAETPIFELVAVIDRKNDGRKLGEIGHFPLPEVPVFSNIEACLQSVEADVLVDLTVPEVGMHHARTALIHNVRPVIGTTGFSPDDLEELKELSAEKGIGCIIAPNFAIGAVLMMKFAKMAAKYFGDVEIIEMHHDRKLDAPSGTAIKTAQLISEEREARKQGHPEEKETLQGARGAEMDGMRIHSVRLPGLIAHQEVLFGSEGQTLKIRHDSYTRASFMSGVKTAVETVMKIDSFVYGLENIME